MAIPLASTCSQASRNRALDAWIRDDDDRVRAVMGSGARPSAPSPRASQRAREETFPPRYIRDTARKPFVLPSGPVTLEGDPSFTLVGRRCDSVTCRVVVRFSPERAGSHSAILRGGSASIGLEGDAYSVGPILRIATPTPMGFRRGSDATKRARLKNEGDAPLTIERIRVVGSRSFRVSSSTCRGAPLPAGARCSVVIAHDGDPSPRRATVRVDANPPQPQAQWDVRNDEVTAQGSFAEPIPVPPRVFGIIGADYRSRAVGVRVYSGGPALVVAELRSGRRILKTRTARVSGKDQIVIRHRLDRHRGDYSVRVVARLGRGLYVAHATARVRMP